MISPYPTSSSLSGSSALAIDLDEYGIREIDRILGILSSMTSPQTSK